MDVLGYRICANEQCQVAVLETVAFKTGGLCFDCARQGLRESLGKLDLAVNGGRVAVSTARAPKTAKNRAAWLRRKDDERVKRRRHASEKARLAAMRRLAAAAPELFALIYADERQKRGLAPLTVHSALRDGPGERAWATLDALAFYRALTSQEITPDDADDAPEDAPPPRN